MTTGDARLRRHYDEKYAAEAAEQPVCYARRRYPANRFEACVRYFPSSFPGGDVLEVGAGKGDIAFSLLTENLKCTSYTLTDFSPVRTERLRRTIADPRCRFEILDVEAIPAERGAAYDAIVLVAVIEHLVDPLLAVRSLHRLLRPGGMLYIDTPNIAKFTRRIKLLAGRFPATATCNEGLSRADGSDVDLHDEGHLHYFSFRSLERMLTHYCGFASTRRLPYACGTPLAGTAIGHALARVWPAMFSELAVVAFTDGPRTADAR